MEINHIINGSAIDVLRVMSNESVDCVVTSPPYWALRDYGCDNQLGLEPTFQEYINNLCDIFDEIKRVLKKEGTCYVNMGDTYGTQSGAMRDGKFGTKNTNNQSFIQPQGTHKSLCQIPSRFSIEMTNRGWILRNEIIWHKPNCMPSSAKDRFTVDYEKVFFFVKSKKYYFQRQLEPFLSNTNDLNKSRNKGAEGKNKIKYLGKPIVSEGDRNWYRFGGRNKRTVWTVTTKPFKEAHFATYPEALIEPMIQSGCPVGGIVLDPFMGAGTTALVAKKQKKNYIGIELNQEYIDIATSRIEGCDLNKINVLHKIKPILENQYKMFG